MSQIQQFKTAALTTAGSGDNTAIAAVTGRVLKVWKLYLTASAAANLVFKDGASTSLSGAVILTGAGSSLFFQYDGSPYWVTSPGNAFIINSSTAGVMTGQIYYSEG